MMAHFNHLSRFENFARELIEGSFDRFFSGKPMANRIANELARSMDNSCSPKDNKVATHYTVYLNTKTLNNIERNLPDLANNLIEYLNSLAKEMGMVNENPFIVEFVSKAGLIDEDIIIETHEVEIADSPTKIRLSGNNNRVSEAIESVDAFLIINGKRHVPLDKPIVSIGRQLDNDIVLDERSVSRKHLQLRWRFGHFMVHDLGSHAGTLVNGDRVSTCVLQAGDVIQLGTATIIYGEEQLGENSELIRPTTRDGSTRELFRND